MTKKDKLDAERNAAKLPDSKFDSKELKKGTDREMEHTKSRVKAEKIAKQHLYDIPDYYSELEKAGIEELEEGSNKPTNPSLWSRAKSAARSKFKVYPSAYANAWASKWYKKHGGGWRKAAKNESIEYDIDSALLCECACGCDKCQMDYQEPAVDAQPYYDIDDEYLQDELYMDEFFNSMRGDPDLNDDGIYDEEELYTHFDLNFDGQVTPEEYESHVNYHAEHPEFFAMKKQIKPAVQAIFEQLGGLAGTPTQQSQPTMQTLNTNVVSPDIDRAIAKTARKPEAINLATKLNNRPENLLQLKKMFNQPQDQLLNQYGGNKETLKKAAEALLLSLNPLEIMSIKDEYNKAKSSGALSEQVQPQQQVDPKNGFKTYLAMNILTSVLEPVAAAIDKKKVATQPDQEKLVETYSDSGLGRWFKEKWVDISRKKDGKHPPCGRKKATDSSYPKCRPSKKVSEKTPKTTKSMSAKDKKKAVRIKRRAEKDVSTASSGREPVMTKLKEGSKEEG